MQSNTSIKVLDNASKDLEFLDFSDALAPHFERINRIWIEDMFHLEDIDKQVLRYPRKHIIEKGGYVFFVKHKTLGVIGTCALLNSGNSNYELTKMGVQADLRGLKVGEKLLEYVIQRALSIPAQTLYLLTNKKCEAAIHLYEKYSFAHDDDIMQSYGKNYERCNVAMRYIAP
ncbi:GNAT family N-acetyltransferase [Glaciecola sp. SC05]|uniref:GNAT family N-acetyltransferase n=1 Tax=Glaciecola sp. SC05 TaxID=1987355 RepID=UPI00352989D8